MKRKHEMPSKIPSRYADVADYTDQSSAWNKNPENMSPYFFQFKEELFIVLDMPKLVRVFIIAFQVPIGRRSDGQMNRRIIKEGELSGIPINKSVVRHRHGLKESRDMAGEDSNKPLNCQILCGICIYSIYAVVRR